MGYGRKDRHLESQRRAGQQVNFAAWKVGEMKEKTILFVCVENAGRSQMAEGFFRKYAPKGYAAASAGTKPVGEINPLTIQAMEEAGIDISAQKSKTVTGDMIRDSAMAVNMGCMDRAECPLLFLNNPVEWAIENPKGKEIEDVRRIRDEIEKRVRELVKDLEQG
jgi:protein-tyrosine-phosphatase